MTTTLQLKVTKRGLFKKVSLERWGELDKAMETLPNLPVSFPHHFSFSQTFTHISLTQQNTVHVYSVLNRMQNVLDKTWKKKHVDIATRIKLTCSEKCQICSNERNVSDLALLQ